MGSARRGDLINYVNNEYEGLLKVNSDIMVALETMVNKYPYRVLSSFTFDAEQKPLRSARLGDDPNYEVVESSNENEVDDEDEDNEEDDTSICHFPDHIEFVRAVREAEKLARETMVRAPYHWRGYRGFVAPSLPRITVPGMQYRLMSALKRIDNLSVPETMVNY